MPGWHAGLVSSKGSETLRPYSTECVEGTFPEAKEKRAVQLFNSSSQNTFLYPLANV